MKLVVGNWKMNPASRADAEALARGVREGVEKHPAVECGVAPPACYLTVVGQAIAGSRVALGAQNAAWEDKGAFTGEISTAMVRDAGGTFVIVGHSERRQLFLENNDIISRRLHHVLGAGFGAILCVGETLKQREAGLTQTILDEQLRGALLDMNPEGLKQLTVAYEPVWAIGTGVVASSAQIAEAHAHIRNYLLKGFGEGLGRTLRVLYGGSVTPENAGEIFATAGVDGALVGGVSLKADSFTELLRLAGAA